MKRDYTHYLLFFILLFGAILTGCAKGNEENRTEIELSEKTLRYDKNGGGQWIDIVTTGRWSIVAVPQWCSVEPSQGRGSQRVRIVVDQNTQLIDRTFSLEFSVDGASSSLELKQYASDKAVIPIVFHLLNSEISQKRIQETIDSLNKFYNETSGNPISVEFILAERSPSGVRLTEPGIERVAMDVTQISPGDFLDINHIKRPEFSPLFWDPNQYINIWIYAFSQSSILGISHLSYSTNHSLEGLTEGSFYQSNLPNYMHGLCLNSMIFRGDTFYSSDGLYTVYHEIGHYLGLFHAFNEKGGGELHPEDAYDDYCSDTPQYDRSAYEKWLSELSPFTDEIYYRTSYLGKRFLATNVMDYDFVKEQKITPQQRERILNVLKYSPLIPGRTMITGKSASTVFQRPIPIIME